jgi:hypothetical protein
MARFVYKILNGRAQDLRFVADNYVKAVDEIEGAGNQLPTLDALSTVPLKNVVQFGIFISRWTAAEYQLLLQRRATAIAAAGTVGMALVKQWDIAATLGQVDLNTQAAQDFKTAIVTAGILTQARADVVFG